jgi:hypothetical protein
MEAHSAALKNLVILKKEFRVVAALLKLMPNIFNRGVSYHFIDILVLSLDSVALTMLPKSSIAMHKTKEIQVLMILEIFNATLFCAVVFHALILNLKYVLLLS